jgi:hypothetical protein
LACKNAYRVGDLLQITLLQLAIINFCGIFYQ